MDFIEIAKNAKQSALKLADVDTETKNKVLQNAADKLEQNAAAIFEANAEDLEAAKHLVDTGEITPAVYKRLKLDKNKLRDMVQGMRDLISLPDPVNKVLLRRRLDEGIVLEKVSCPIGVLGVIFEARPDVIAQISALAIKSANAVIVATSTPKCMRKTLVAARM